MSVLHSESASAVSSLLGQKRQHAYVSASTLSASKSSSEILDRLRNQAKKFSAFRCKGAADHTENLHRLTFMREVNQELSKNTAYWLDLNEALSPESAGEFIKLVVSWMKEEKNKNQLMILEQPVPKKFVRELCALQKLCDDLLPESHGKIAIMADESLWDLEDFKQLMHYGGCSAINIKVPKVGGLIKALQLGEYVNKHSPETMVYIGGMIGTSDIMGRAIYNLYKSLPRIDFCTTSPARNVEKNLAITPLEYTSPESSEILLGTGFGLGSDLDYQAIEEFKDRGPWEVDGLSVIESNSFDDTNYYDRGELLGFKQKELDSHLIEREALLLGLSTTRASLTHFSVSHPDSDRKITFRWTMASGLPKSTRLICQKKDIAKQKFKAAGAPVAEGTVFDVGTSLNKVVEYVESIGWPVVVKPGVGTGGVGVVANIQKVEDLKWAINNIETSKVTNSRNDGTFIVEKHVTGIELRVLVAGGKALSAVERIQPHIVGDGVNNISQLINIKNNARSKNPNLSNSKLKKGEATKFELKRQGKTLGSIPDAGEVVTISPVFSISQGADSRSVIDLVHPSVLKAAVKAVEGVEGLYETGVDFILQDYTLPVDGQQACICEVNYSPAISSAHFPMYGPAVNVAREFLCSVLARKWGKDYSHLETKVDTSSGLRIEVENGLDKGEIRELLQLFSKEGVDCQVDSYKFTTVLTCKGEFSKIVTCPSVVSKLISSTENVRNVASYLIG
ncbi:MULTISPECIES: enolase C-terminal domain-like protein [unclassified Halomonas]|uniref:enolase C-terminal domain-like protein n=1 Tax=unclassified Halomonas TaxID=2609666 RepID=UPI0009906028|nr:MULTISPECIES: enolase C-terminal domain-like protein [unclassified Halomonas]AVU09026.1 hypothetical protein BV504_04270 [Halomonas sp. 'Soap Lake \